MSYLNGLVVSPIFFNLSLNFAIRSSWSEPRSAQSCFTQCIENSFVFGFKEYNQSDFGIDYLVKSMCRIISCFAERVCFPWLVHSLGKTVLAFALLILYAKAKLACYSKYLLTSYLWLPIPYAERTSFLRVSSRSSCRSSRYLSKSSLIFVVGA